MLELTSVSHQTLLEKTSKLSEYMVNIFRSRIYILEMYSFRESPSNWESVERWWWGSQNWGQSHHSPHHRQDHHCSSEYRNTYKYVDYTRGKTNKKYRGNVLRYKYVCWGQLLCYNLYQAYHPYMDSAHSKDCLMPFKLGLRWIHDE